MSPWIPAAWLFITALSVIEHTAKHGQKRDDNYSGPGRFAAAAIIAALLWWGGFFAPLREWL